MFGYTLVALALALIPFARTAPPGAAAAAAAHATSGPDCRQGERNRTPDRLCCVRRMLGRVESVICGVLG